MRLPLGFCQLSLKLTPFVASSMPNDQNPVAKLSTQVL